MEKWNRKFSALEVIFYQSSPPTDWPKVKRELKDSRKLKDFMEDKKINPMFMIKTNQAIPK